MVMDAPIPGDIATVIARHATESPVREDVIKPMLVEVTSIVAC